MSLTVQQLLADARRLSTRLKDHDQSADQLLSRSQEVLKEVDAMRQYQENIENLNELAHNRPRAHLVLGIQQENRHIRSLQQENKELRAALEEHQSALELIMSKYREHITSMIKCSGKLECSSTSSNQLILDKTEKVCEMAAVMKEAVRRDEEKEGENQELIARLYTENKGLREMLGISQKHRSLPSQQKHMNSVDQGMQTEDPVESRTDALSLEVTLPMPAPPPRANRSPQVAQKKPVTPEVVEKDSRLSVSPVEPSNSASESDETSDDDSVKFDTIKKYSRRVTAVPANIVKDASKIAEKAVDSTKSVVDPSPAAVTESAQELSNKINNNQEQSPTVPATQNYSADNPTETSAKSSPSPPTAVLPPSADTAGQVPTATTIPDVTAATKNSENSSKEPRESEAAATPPIAVTDSDEPVSVTNCESILNDIITDTVNNSKR